MQNDDERPDPFFLWFLISPLLVALFILSCPIGQGTWVRLAIGVLSLMLGVTRLMMDYRNTPVPREKLRYCLESSAWFLLALLAITKALGFFPDLK